MFKGFVRNYYKGLRNQNLNLQVTNALCPPLEVRRNEILYESMGTA